VHFLGDLAWLVEHAFLRTVFRVPLDAFLPYLTICLEKKGAAPDELTTDRS
jgi:hypothetical protein